MKRMAMLLVLGTVLATGTAMASGSGDWDEAASRVSVAGGDWNVLIGATDDNGQNIVEQLGSKLRSDIPFYWPEERFEEFLDYLWGANWRAEEIARRGSLRRMSDYWDQLKKQVDLMVAEPTAARLEWGYGVHLSIRNSLLQDARW